VEVRIGDTPVPVGTGIITQNVRCMYQQQPADVHSVVTFTCPSPGLKGNTVTVQQLNTDRIYVVEVEALGTNCHPVVPDFFGTAYQKRGKYI
jgi:hypothetical protein